MSDKAPSSTPGVPGAPSKPGSGEKPKATPANDPAATQADKSTEKQASAQKS